MQTKAVKPFVAELERQGIKGKKIWYDETLHTIFIIKTFANESGGGCPGNHSIIGKACHCQFYNHLQTFYPKYYCQCNAEYYGSMFEPMFGKDIELYPSPPAFEKAGSKLLMFRSRAGARLLSFK